MPKSSVFTAQHYSIFMFALIGIATILLVPLTSAHSDEESDEPLSPPGRLAIADSLQREDQDDDNADKQAPLYHMSLPHKWLLHQYHQQQSRLLPPPMTVAANGQRKKKDCGLPIPARRLFGTIVKRSSPIHFANSEDEVNAKIKEEDTALRMKRSADFPESHPGGCVAKRQWIDMGTDYYPRYVKSYQCSSANCDRGFGSVGECKAKHYTTKVLKQVTPSDTAAAEDCDHTLPETLRYDWKLVSVTVTTCCDCVSPARLF